MLAGGVFQMGCEDRDEAGAGSVLPFATGVGGDTDIVPAEGELWTVLHRGRPLCFAVAPTAATAVGIGAMLLGRLGIEGRAANDAGAALLTAVPPSEAERAFFAAQIALQGSFGPFVSGLPIDADELEAAISAISGSSVLA
ncbi:MAG: hypothetical protein U1E53_17485 [Dongiaceae bacterium]